jgi:hypothetical protein
VGSGPLLPPVFDEMAQECQDNWWTNLLYINNYVAEDRMVSTVFIMATHTIEVSKDISGKRPLGRPRRGWVDNIKMVLGEIGWVYWIYLPQDREINFRVL